LEENDYQIVQAIAGRMRVRAAWLETDQAASGKLQRLIEALNYVSSVRINPLAQSIIITYQSGKISVQDAEAQIISAIHEVKPPAPVEPTTAKQPEEIKLPEILHPPAPTAQPPPKSAATSAIPSPWDEPDRAVIRETVGAALPSEVEPTKEEEVGAIAGEVIGTDIAKEPVEKFERIEYTHAIGLDNDRGTAGAQSEESIESHLSHQKLDRQSIKPGRPREPRKKS
jgi:Heavy metal associated domain 2